MPKYDPMRPQHEPARQFYDLLIQEASKRKQRSFPQWAEIERATMHKAAVDYARSHHLYEPTNQDIVAAETDAMGHVDYAAKFAIKVSEIVQNGFRHYPKSSPDSV